jgi:hypothetical protein|tara:strand:+ start:9325 stop:9909 length:585 start_codon:yes stop_codon:yes gene_type:complete
MSHASEVSIGNEALLLLGASTITSFDDDDPNAVLVDRFYHNERDSILRSHRWNCAIETVNLASLSATPIIDWEYQFTLPVDPYCLRVLDVRTVTGDVHLDFAVQGRRLLTEESAVDITYIKRVEDPSQFDALLYQTIVFRLAWKLAFPITRSHTVMTHMGTMYEAVAREARAIDSQEGTPETIVTDTLTDVRLR